MLVLKAENIQCSDFQVAEQDGNLPVDALVNSGNTLAAWAEHENPSNAMQLLQQAAEAYRTALSKEEDALVRIRPHFQYCPCIFSNTRG